MARNRETGKGVICQHSTVVSIWFISERVLGYEAESMADYTEEGELVFLGKGEERFTRAELLSYEAEEIGGDFCSSYKVFLDSGFAVVVKRFHSDYDSVAWRQKLQALGNFVHENLMPLRAYSFSGKGDKLIICDYMANGSLFARLHERKGLDWTPLSWEDRTRIAYGVACGINYLHSHGPEVCHGNIQSSNVFLTDSGDARLSEYGIAQLVSTESHITLASGNHAPQVNYSHEFSHQADVYSFGVLLLELLTGLPPAKSSSNKEGTDLPRWVRLMFQEKPILKVLDKELQKYQKYDQQMFLLLQLAICCTFQYPNKRPLMSVVTDQIKMICRI